MGITSKAGKLLLIVGAICLTNVATTPLPKDKQCTTQKGTIGVCRNVDDCPLHSWNVPDEGDPRASACGSNGRQRAEVCCSLDSRTPQRPRGAGNTAPRPSSRSQTTPNAPASKTKSEQKCEEYIREAKRLTRSGKPNTLCVENVVSGRAAYGGDDAKPKEFPHMVAVGYGQKGNEQWLCGGTLISPNYVLTAGHCLKDYRVGDAKWVRLGAVNVTWNRDPSLEQTFAVAQRIAHPDYHPSANYNDIGLLRLDGRVRFTEAVRPACLTAEGGKGRNSVRPGSAYATGWGVTESGSSSNTLQKVRLVLTSQEFCNKTYDPSRFRAKLRKGISNEMFCAGGDAQGSKDTCKGDSGGPLQLVYDIESCVYEVLGITSFGRDCGEPNVPGVYTRVSSYLRWIESIVWP